MRPFFSLLLILTLMPFMAEAETAGDVKSVAYCGSCHTKIKAMWGSSMHSQAVSDPIFKAAYMEAFLKSNGTASKLCLNCHAPATKVNADLELKQDISKEGVTCHVCHSISEVHLEEKVGKRITIQPSKTIYGPNGTPAGKAHQSTKSALHKDSKLCAACHQYESSGITIMGTFAEWKKSKYKTEGIQCQNCHMPKQNGKKQLYGHYFEGGHSITQLKKAVQITILSVKKKSDRVVVELELENSGAGHMLPTGIPSRKLVLTTAISGGNNRTIKKQIIYEKVIFDENGKELKKDSDIMLGLGRKIAKDNRLAPNEKRRERIIFYTEVTGSLLVSAKVEYLYRPLLLQSEEMKYEMNRTEKIISGGSN